MIAASQVWCENTGETNMKRTGLGVALFAAFLLTAGQAAARDKFDGNWALYIMGDSGVCEFGYRVPIRIDGRLVHYNGRTINPSMVAISDSGSVAIRLDNGSTRVTGSGALSSGRGSGKWSAPSFHCTGRWHAERQ
jgi:hypothetical protein